MININNIARGLPHYIIWFNCTHVENERNACLLAFFVFFFFLKIRSYISRPAFVHIFFLLNQHRRIKIKLKYSSNCFSGLHWNHVKLSPSPIWRSNYISRRIARNFSLVHLRLIFLFLFCNFPWEFCIWSCDIYGTYHVVDDHSPKFGQLLKRTRGRSKSCMIWNLKKKCYSRNKYFILSII